MFTHKNAAHFLALHCKARNFLKESFPITIDFDIKQTMKNRQLDDNLLKEIYEEFKGYLDEIFINDANYTCYILMRNRPLIYYFYK